MTFKPDYEPCEKCKPLFDGLFEDFFETQECYRADLTTLREALSIFADRNNWEVWASIMAEDDPDAEWDFIGGNPIDIATLALDTISADVVNKINNNDIPCAENTPLHVANTCPKCSLPYEPACDCEEGE